MELFQLRAGEEFIRLGQVLKATGLVENGGEDKKKNQDGLVNGKGKNEKRRGRKLYKGGIGSYDGEEGKGDVGGVFCQEEGEYEALRLKKS